MKKRTKIWGCIMAGVASAAILPVSGIATPAKASTHPRNPNIHDPQQLSLVLTEPERRRDRNSNVLEADTLVAQKSRDRREPRSEAERLYRAGMRLFREGTAESLRSALTPLEQAASLARQAGNQSLEADSLFGIGRVYYSLVENQQALDYYERALSLFQAEGDRAGEARVLNDTGRVYNFLGEREQALDYYERALPLFQDAGDRLGEAYAFNNMGRLYNSLGEKEQALDYYERALPLFQDTDDRLGEGRVLNNIGRVYNSLGEKQQALEYYQRALPLFQAGRDFGRKGRVLDNIGRIYDDLGETQQALDYYERALSLFQTAGDPGGEARVLNNMGRLYNSLGEKEKALDDYQRALLLQQEVGDRGGEATTLNNMGRLYNSLGEKEKALDYYQRALPLFEATGGRGGEATTLNNMGRVYDDLGEMQQALNYYQQAFLLFQAVGDPAGKARTLNNIGFIYSSLGEKEKALDYYQRALPFSLKYPAREAPILKNIGFIYSSLGEKEKALDYYQRALSLFQAVGDPAGEARTRNHMGRVYSALGEKEKALDYYQHALPLLQAVGDREGEAQILRNIAFLQRSQGNLETALTEIEKSIAILENLRTKAPTTELRQTYFASVHNYYQFYLDLLMELHRQNPDRGYDARAFQASESSRARTLTEILTEAQFDLKADLPPTLLAEEKRLNQALSTAEQQRVELLQKSYSNDELAAITNAIEQILQDLQDLEARIRRENPAYANLKYPKPLTLQQIQTQILDADTLLLEYALGEERSYLFAVSKDSFTAYELPSRQEIETATERYITALQAEDRNPLAEGTELVKMLLDPVADKLKNQRLAIVADGKLNRLPFGALPWGASGAGASIAPLLANHEIINLSSASSLEAQRSQWAKRTPAPKAIAVLADPVFSPRDPRLSGDTPPTTEENPLLGLLQRGCNSFDRLPNTQREAENILKLVPDDQEFLALGFAANRSQALNANLSQYQILHLATHGCIQDDPLRSGLVLSLYDEKGKSQDGLLRLQDIYNLDLNAELVVLSACQTGIGEEVNGEGVVGLTRGFMYAGAKRVVVSLWNVNDAATANLMTDYYQQMLGSGLNPISALREAQLKMWREGELPYKWAAFTVQGDWQ
ncbi:MAG: tetratricopeptide repeat protein [Cyanobacteria bacterium P01_E01_bin.42]